MKKLFSDRKVCTGCRTCEMICSFSHRKTEVNPRKARIRIRQDLLQGRNEPVVCRQCPKPKCVEACPEKAIQQHPELKNPVIDPAKCTLCLACQEACPFGAIFFDGEEKELLVCDLCQGDPMCVKFCRPYPHKTHAALGYMDPKEWGQLTRRPPPTE